MLALRLDTRGLWVHLALAVAYAIPILTVGAVTGHAIADGILGGMLGLYVCSLPARHAIDTGFVSRQAVRRLWSTWLGARWLTLNVMVLLAGWLVIFLGMTCLVGA
jgi:hypothetical protein